jgi:hypothetical protein
MQVLEILSAHEHRIVAHPVDTLPPAGMQPWGVDCDAALPFARVWADAALQDETIAEIVNGYCPPPAGQPMTVRPDLGA